MSPPIKDDISREMTILMTSLWTRRTSAFTTTILPFPLAPLRGHCIHYLAPLNISQLFGNRSRQLPRLIEKLPQWL